jgi:uncharacterized protein YjiS (DUF1127 family)
MHAPGWMKPPASGRDQARPGKEVEEMGIINSLFRTARRRKIYADLLNLDDHLLRDIGLDRTDVHNIVSGRGNKVVRTHE